MGGDGGWEALDYQLWGSLNCCERGRARLMRRSDRKCDKQHWLKVGDKVCDGPDIGILPFLI